MNVSLAHWLCICKHLIGANFDITNPGSSCSDELKDTIDSVEECRQAADELYKIFEKEIYNFRQPKGCFLYSNKYVYWNNYEADGQGHGKSQAICRANGKFIFSLSLQKQVNHLIQKFDTTTSTYFIPFIHFYRCILDQPTRTYNNDKRR